LTERESGAGETEMTKACIIGVSAFGAVHYEDLMREVSAGRMQAVAATIRHQDKEKEKCQRLRELNCTIFDDYRKMLEFCRGKADLCMITTGIPLHMPMTIDSLNAGLNVYMEKPAAGAIQDVRAMQDAAKKAGKIVAVAFQDLYNPANMELKRAILSGSIGKIQIMKSFANWPKMDDYYSRNNWSGRLRIGETWALDTPFNNAMAHEVMMMLFLAGASERKAAFPTEVEAELYRAHKIESADTACVRLKTNTNMTVMFLFSHAGENGAASEIEIRGDKGTIKWSRSGATMETLDGVKKQFTAPPMPELRDGMLQAACAAAAGENVFYCDLEMASMQTLAVNGAHEAASITTVPEEFVSRTVAGERVKDVLKGLDQAIWNGYQQGKMFSEMAVPWAVSPGKYSLRGFTRFNGSKVLKGS
jgi:predicted dehydrogenase